MLSPMLRADTLALVFAVDVATALSDLHAEMRAMQGARITRLAVVAGEAAVAGEVVTGIRTLDIPSSAITARATAIRMADITVTDPVGAMIRITDIVRADLIPTATGTGRTWASASIKLARC